MTRAEAVQSYVAISPENRCRFLLGLSAVLTVSARTFMSEEVSDVDARKALAGISELQHNIAEEALHHLAGRKERYPDDVLINILIEKADAYGISGHLRYALEKALSHEE